jgi:hypothetical protein
MTAGPSVNPSELIDKHIADLADWRGKMLATFAKPSMMLTPRSSRNGNGWAVRVGLMMD